MSRLSGFAFLKAQRLLGARAERYYREFLRLEGASAGELRALEGERLSNLLRHATANVPYYRELVSKANPELRDFPILTRDALRCQFDRLMTAELALEYARGESSRYSWLLVRSGGTTGTPATVIHDRRCRDFGRASRLYSQGLCGFAFGTPYLRLWGSMKDINRMRDSLAQRVTRWLARETLLNAFRMDEDRMRLYLDVIRRSSARHLMAYVDSAAQLARFSREKRIGLRPLQSLMACAGTVTPEARALLEAAFGGKVHNKYGSRECTDMACECSRGGLHIYSNHVRLEVADSGGRPLPPGEPGRILVTLLNSYSFPLIRYEIGDIGALGEEPCACGRPFPLLASVEGRTAETIRTKSGSRILPAVIRHLVGVAHNPGIIRRFQFIQNSVSDCELALEVQENAPETLYLTAVEALERDLAVALGDGCTVKTRRVARIEEADNGKFRYVISRIP